jgi:hypothetical protein
MMIAEELLQLQIQDPKTAPRLHRSLLLSVRPGNGASMVVICEIAAKYTQLVKIYR